MAGLVSGLEKALKAANPLAETVLGVLWMYLVVKILVRLFYPEEVAVEAVLVASIAKLYEPPQVNIIVQLPELHLQGTPQ